MKTAVENILHSVPVQDEMYKILHGQNSYRLERPFESLLHDNHRPNPDLAMEIMTLKPMQEDQIGIKLRKITLLSLAVDQTSEHMDDEFFTEAYPKTVYFISSSNAPFTELSHRLSRRHWSSPSTNINTEAKTINHISPPDITPFIRFQSKIPTVVDEYLGTKLDDALLKILERHTADLIEKYSVLPGPESIKNQESLKKRVLLFKHMNKNKTANRNPANYHLYHALMEALIADEDAMDKEVTVKLESKPRVDAAREDEDPESAASGSANLHEKMELDPSQGFLMRKANSLVGIADVVKEHLDRDDNVGMIM
ncbi:hypothetical protein Tco_0403425 [Tanacetum coccineum]